jgi:hypothetical protein
MRIKIARRRKVLPKSLVPIRLFIRTKAATSNNNPLGFDAVRIGLGNVRYYPKNGG